MQVRLIFVFAVYELIVYSQALTCLTCENVGSNEECMAQGRSVECEENEHVCFTEVRTNTRGMVIFKRCKQINACSNNYIQNPRPAWFPTQCNLDFPHTVCRCCCGFDGCNEPLQCLAGPESCPMIGTPVNGEKECFYNNFENEIGSTCLFTCNANFVLVGEYTSTCMDTGDGITAEFDNPLPTCEPITCNPPLANPVNGQVSCTDSNTYNSFCQYTCNEGFHLRGTDVTCLADGRWSVPPALCEPLTCQPRHRTPTNGDMQCINDNNENSACIFSCSAGFVLVGNSVSVCQDDGDNDARGLWSEPTPICREFSCPMRTPPINGRLRFCTLGNSVTSTCFYECDQFVFLSGSARSTCLDDGTWSADVPTCHRVTCDPPHVAPENGVLSCSDGNYLGSECFFSCDLGFGLGSGAPVSLCTDQFRDDEEGEWTNPTPVCSEFRCSIREAPENGVIDCSNQNFVNSECFYSCNPGFALQGIFISVCQENGIWNNEEPSCIRIRCVPPHGPPSNGDVFCTDSNYQDSVCSFDCEVGFELIGESNSMCQDDFGSDQFGFWTSVAPICREIVCSERGPPANGDVGCTNGVIFESECFYGCDPGFFLTGSPRAICLIDGTWSDDVPTCVRITCEPPHVAPEDGTVDCTDVNNENSVCSFTCDLGFELIGSPESTCLDDFDNNALGLWTSPAPTCRAIVCPERNLPANGEVECSNGEFFESTCSYSCDAGFFLSGSDQATCLIDGTWSRDVPSCVRIRCIPPHRSPIDGEVSCTNENFLDSICSFSCDLGFELIGEQQSTCLDDFNNDALGSWSSRAAACRAIVCSERLPPRNGEQDCTNTEFFDSVCTFTCNPRYVLVGDDTSRCQLDGFWSTEVPLCDLNMCGDPPPAPENGFLVCTDGNLLGSQCEYGCEGLHIRVGPLYSNCVELEDGSLVWDNLAPVCQRTECPDQGPLEHGAITCSDDNFAESQCTFECLEPNFELFPQNAVENTCFNDTTWSVPEPCCTRPCPPFAEFDAVFILDSSSSVGLENWELLTNFSRGLLEAFNLGGDLARLAVFRYNRVVDESTQILLNEFTGAGDREALVAAFNDIPYDGSGTRTGRALRHALNVVLTPENGDRPGVDNVVVLITDGRSQDDVVGISQQLRESGAIVYVIGILPPGNVIGRGQLNDIVGADNPNNLILLEGGFAGLDETFLNRISTQICGDPCDD